MAWEAKLKSLTKLKHTKSFVEYRTFNVHACNLMGESGFHIQHPIFVSSQVMYVVVYDASKPLSCVGDDVNAWLEAIRSKTFTSPILVVGSNSAPTTKFVTA